MKMIWGLLAVVFATAVFCVAQPANVQAASATVESLTSNAVPGNDVFVRWRLGTSPSIVRDAYARAGVEIVWRSSLVKGLERVAPASAVDAEQTLQILRATPGVVYAHPNFRVHRRMAPMPAFHSEGNMRLQSFAAPNDPLFGEQWALRSGTGISIEKAWDIVRGDERVRVAVIDTGVDPAHVEMGGRLAPGYDFIDKTAEVTDHHGHGTHVSGIIGANTNNNQGIAGINQAVTIIPIRAVPSDSDETDADVIASFEFAVKAGARVANCSFGKRQSAQAVGDTIAAAGQHGLLAVVAAGNESTDLNSGTSYPASFQTPNMIVVAASTIRGGLANFSNYGKGKVDLAAPGADILSSTQGDYASWSGTSMAAPQVAGVAALMLAAKPDLTPEQLKAILLKSVDHEPKLEGRVTTGGRLNAAAAVQAAASVTSHFTMY